MCFPDENYDYDELSGNSIFVGAYDGEKCVGVAIYQHSWNKYLYLYDLKVNVAYRGQKIGSRLIVKNGFEIGGIDTKVYNGTKQEDKFDIIFYAENEGEKT